MRFDKLLDHATALTEAAATRKYVRYQKLCAFVGGAFIFSLVIFSGALILSDDSTCVFVGKLWCIFAATSWFLEVACTYRKDLRTLSDSPSECEQALDLVEKSSVAEAYRNKIIETGRQLRALDLRIMLHLVQLEEERVSAENAKSICKKLHSA